MPSRAIGTSTVFASSYLFEKAFPTFEIHLENFVTGAERVQLRPAIEVLEGVVWPIVGAPAHEALQITAVVEAAFKKLAASRDVFGQKPPFQHRPLGWLHWVGNSDGDICRRRPSQRSPGTNWSIPRRASVVCTLQVLCSSST